MVRLRILSASLAVLVVGAALAAITGALPDPTWIGWAIAFGTVVLAGWVFVAVATASQQLRVRRLRGRHARARHKLLLLVRQLRDASATVASAAVPADAPASARAACERLSQSVLGFHLGRPGWDPLARDLTHLRVVIRSAHAMMQLRPDQQRLVGCPFRFVQEHCDEVLQRQGPLPSPGSATRPLKSGTPA
jgi:hypothetical protein